MHFFSNSVLLGVLKAFLRCPPGCWMVCLPEVLSPILSPNLSFFLFPFVAGGLILHFCPNSVWLGVRNAFSCHVFDPVPQKHVLNPPTVWGLRWCSLSSISLIPRTELLHYWLKSDLLVWVYRAPVCGLCSRARQIRNGGTIQHRHTCGEKRGEAR